METEATLSWPRCHGDYTKVTNAVTNLIGDLLKFYSHIIYTDEFNSMLFCIYIYTHNSHLLSLISGFL